MSENRVVEQCSASSSGLTNFPTRANVTLVDGHGEDAHFLMHRVKGTIAGRGPGWGGGSGKEIAQGWSISQLQVARDVVISQSDFYVLYYSTYPLAKQK